MTFCIKIIFVVKIILAEMSMSYCTPNISCQAQDSEAVTNPVASLGPWEMSQPYMVNL